jgi:hypothetical protein
MMEKHIWSTTGAPVDPKQEEEPKVPADIESSVEEEEDEDDFEDDDDEDEDEDDSEVV